MFAFSVASGKEWRALLELLNIKESDLQQSPFGDYFEMQHTLFFRSLTRKSLASASTQWMLNHYRIDHVLVIGTCAGVDKKNSELDLFQFNKAVQGDILPKALYGKMCVGEISLFCFDELSFLKSGTISTIDKPLIELEEALQLQSEGITCDDMESAAIALVCEMNHTPCTVIKGISDFPRGIMGFDAQDENYQKNTKLVMKRIVEQVLPVLWRIAYGNKTSDR